MGIFSRITDIVNSNINAMLDRAEDPEKMVKLMIHEMEDTLTEVKSAAAEVVADKIRLTRVIASEKSKQESWAKKAELALEKGRDDLAREAVERKLAAEKAVTDQQKRLNEVEELVKQYQNDIARLEDKLANARRRQSSLIASHQSALNRKIVEDKIYKINTTGAFAKFDSYENRIDRYNAEADVMQHSNVSLESQFEELEQGSDVEDELARLKASLKSGKQSGKSKNSETAAAVK